LGSNRRQSRSKEKDRSKEERGGGEKVRFETHLDEPELGRKVNRRIGLDCERAKVAVSTRRNRGREDIENVD